MHPKINSLNPGLALLVVPARNRKVTSYQAHSPSQQSALDGMPVAEPTVWNFAQLLTPHTSPGAQPTLSSESQSTHTHTHTHTRTHARWAHCVDEKVLKRVTLSATEPGVQNTTKQNAHHVNQVHTNRHRQGRTSWCRSTLIGASRTISCSSSNCRAHSPSPRCTALLDVWEGKGMRRGVSVSVTRGLNQQNKK